MIGNEAVAGEGQERLDDSQMSQFCPMRYRTL